MENTDLISIIQYIAGVPAIIFSVYKLFFEKKKNDITLDGNKIKFLKELDNFEQEKFKKLMNDYKEAIKNESRLRELLEEQRSNEQELKNIIDNQAFTIFKYEKLLKRNKIEYDDK